MKNPFAKKPFITQVMLRAQKAYRKKQGTLASCILVAFLPEQPLQTAPKKKRLDPHYGNKKLRMAMKGKCNGQIKHGLAGSVIARMKQDKILNTRGK